MKLNPYRGWDKRLKKENKDIVCTISLDTEFYIDKYIHDWYHKISIGKIEKPKHHPNTNIFK